MRADDRALVDLAASVADGTPIDWDAVEGRAPGRERRIARHLRLVESIAALHRSVPATEPDTTQTQIGSPDGKRWGRLVLLEVIGQGTSCDVHRAWDTELHRNVALKLLHDDGFEGQRATGERVTADRETRERLMNEARRLARLRHEHVVQVYGAEEHDGRVGLWTELVRGESLEEIVQRSGPLGAREAALVGLDVCAALAAVHGAGLLHRDVKAQNVMREGGGRIVLMDFGTGEDLSSGTSRLVGTPLYLAPEIFAGQKASVQSDIYSLGVMLFYLVTGNFPVMAATMEQLRQAHANRQQRTLRDLRPDVPEAFIRVVERALDSDPSRRFRSIGELEQGLRESLDRVPAPRAVVDAATPKRRVGLPFAAAAIALAMLVVALIVWTRTSSQTPGANEVTRVAVLPFRDISGDSRMPYLADQLTDQLISTLGGVGALQVPSLTSVMEFRGHSGSIVEIGRKLRVDDIVEGTVLLIPGKNADGDRVRVNARLIAAGTDSQIWAQQFERSLGDTAAMHADIAKAIAARVNAVVTPAELRRWEQTLKTNPAAAEAYFEGVNYLSQSSADGQRAVDAFRRATSLDPNHAAAHAGLARGLFTLGFLGTTSHQEARVMALTEVNRALEIDPDSAEAHAARADLQFYYDWDWAGAEHSYKRAIDLNGSFARARSQYARFLSAAGRSEDAVSQASQATEIDPTSASAASTRAMALYYARDYPGAFQAIEHALALESGSASAYLVLSRIDEARGDLAAALLSAERALTIAGNGASTAWRVHVIRLHALLGEPEKARMALGQLSSDVAAGRRRVSTMQFALAHAALGDREQALQFFERALEEREPDMLWLAVDPRADDLRSEPRLKQVAAKLGIPR